MPEIAALLSFAAVVAAAAAPAVVIVRLLGGPDADREPGTLPADLPWPRGVQEDEPVAWRFAPAGG